MPRKPVWRGSKAIHLQPGYPEFLSRGDSEGFRFVWEGPYRTLLAQKPAKGAQINGYPGYYVDDILIKPREAGPDGPGVMNVSVVGMGSGGTATPDAAVSDEVVEIDAGSLDKSILTHPRFAQIPEKEVARIRKAVEDKAEAPPEFDDIGASWIDEAYKLFALLSKNVETYMVSAPVVTITTTSITKPGVGKIGVGTRTADKPHADAPDGYVWIKSGDRAIRQGAKGKWERIQSWMAADDWDITLYGPEPTS